VAGRIQVDPSNPSQTVVTSSRASALVALAVVAGFFVVWYSMLFGDCGSLEDLRRKLAADPMLWIFAIFPVTFLPAVARLAMRIGSGDRLVIDSLRAEISRNGQHLAAFPDVEEIEIRQSGGGGSPCSLVLHLRDGRELPIVDGQREDRLRALVDPVVRVANVPVRVTAPEPAPPGSRLTRRTHFPRRQ
jgi:hypothetical protein